MPVVLLIPSYWQAVAIRDRQQFQIHHRLGQFIEVRRSFEK
jgi:hypothetical protein